VPAAIIGVMTDVTQILSQIEQGDPAAAEQLLPLVYEELRKLATARLAQEKPGQTLQATALVHEAYLRLSDGQCAQDWDSRWHFFAAAAEAMRRIVLNRARDKQRLKRGGDWHRIDLDLLDLANDGRDDQLIELDDALDELACEDSVAADIVKLRFFAGLKQREVATTLGVSLRTAERQWAFARAWLYDRLSRGANRSGE
jgi:RNA polymerase sigma factor (TIGR02999 family)